jgi:hypothetical protein
VCAMLGHREFTIATLGHTARMSRGFDLIRRIWSRYRDSPSRGLAAFALLLVPSGWPRGAVFLAAFVILATLYVRGLRTPHRQRNTWELLFAAAMLLLAVEEFVVHSYTVSTLVEVPALLCIAAVLLFNRDVSFDASRADKIRFSIWCAAAASVGVAGTVVTVHRARHHAPDTSWAAYFAGWELVCTASLLIVATLGGLWVFHSGTDWTQVMILAVLGGTVPFFAIAPTLVLMGEGNPTGIVGSCLGGHHSCARFGEVAGYMAIASPIAVAAVFLAAYSVKWRLTRGSGLPALSV